MSKKAPLVHYTPPHLRIGSELEAAKETVYVPSKPALAIYKPPHLRTASFESKNNNNTGNVNDSSNNNEAMSIDEDSNGNVASEVTESVPSRTRTPHAVYVPPHMRSGAFASEVNSDTEIKSKRSASSSPNVVSSVLPGAVPVEVQSVFFTARTAESSGSSRTAESFGSSSALGHQSSSYQRINNSNSSNSISSSSSRPRDCSVDFPDEVRAARCSLVVSGFPVEIPAYSKEAMLEPFYQYGGSVKWLVGNKALIVFRDEGVCRLALAAAAGRRNSLLRVDTLEQYEQSSSLSKMRSSDEINLLASMSCYRAV